MSVAVKHRNLDPIAFLRVFLDVGADASVLAPWSLQLIVANMNC
jgi:hypothetical protein